MLIPTTIKSKKISEFDDKSEVTVLTGNPNLDKWFSTDHGIVLNSWIFVTGTPGAGKTTFMMYLINLLKGVKISFYERETSFLSVKKQTKNIKINNPNAYCADKKTIPHFEDYLKELDSIKPSMVMVDSLQAIADEDYPDLSSVDARLLVLNKLREWTAKNNATLFLIGHNNKEGDFAGENKLMQYMDAHIEMTYNKKTSERIISWGHKNRKGPMGQLYYTIDNNGMDFYTASEWSLMRIKNNTNDFIDFLEQSLQYYINKINTEHKNYKVFRKEFSDVEKHARTTFGVDNVEYYSYMIAQINELIEKYEVN